MRTIQQQVTISFVNGTSSNSTTLNDGTILVDPKSTPSSTPTTVDCTKDKIIFLTDFTMIDYFISSSSGFKVLKPTILQWIPGCPVSCTLDENGSVGIISKTIFNLSPTDGRVSIKTTDVTNAKDVQMKLSCTSISSTQTTFNKATDDFIVSLKVPGTNCYMDILDLLHPIKQNNDYVVESPANILQLNPGLTQEIPGCPVICTLGEVPSFTKYDTSTINFNTHTGEAFITTSESSIQFTSMSFIITCTSSESIHMEALRTVTDTFTVNFKNPAAGNCEEA